MDELKELQQQRDEIFKKIGQCMLQKKYYEQNIEKLLIEQELLCDKIFKIEKIGKIGNLLCLLSLSEK